MRSWKISGLRDLIFDGPTIWLVVGQCRMTKLIKFDPSTCNHIDITKPDWAYNRAAYMANVTPVGPVHERQGFLVPSQYYTNSQYPKSFSYVDMEAIAHTILDRDLTEPLFTERDSTRFYLPDVTLRAECDGISIAGDRCILADGERAPSEPHGCPRKWQVNIFSPGRMATTVLPVSWILCHATTHGMTFGEHFVDFDANVITSRQGMHLLDVLGERRMERNFPGRGAGSRLYLDGNCYDFVRPVYGARFSPDGTTAFVWGARKLVQFDLD